MPVVPVSPTRPRLPAWFKRSLPASAESSETNAIVRKHGLVTVCEEATCPNRQECWAKRAATFMLMGDHCTRTCTFCDVKWAKAPAALDASEPQRLAAAIHELGLRFAVITSVNRDDLADGGSAHFAATIQAVRAAGIACFGPSAQAAQLEGSKAFAKDVMAEAGVPTAMAHVCRTEAELDEAIDALGPPYVVKDDGLAAGKGVTVATDLAAAVDAVTECFDGRFGDAGARVVIEEFLEGPEVSLLAFVDGATVLPMAPARDHKRAFDGDTGPNTGGMGVYSPVPGIAVEDYARMVEILETTARALHADGVDFRGVLYGGFMLTAEGPKVLEYNTRFGDPETQVLLPRLQTDLAEILWAVAVGRLAELETPVWSADVAVSVVMASGGYPGEYETGKSITGIDDAQGIPGVIVYHAGTTLAEDGTVLTAGGRVLNVTAFGADFPEAIDRAYRAATAIGFEGAFYRLDIAQRALAAQPVAE